MIVFAFDLTAEGAELLIRNITEIKLADNVTFEVKNSETIRDEFDYPGVRVYITARFEGSIQNSEGFSSEKLSYLSVAFNDIFEATKLIKAKRTTCMKFLSGYTHFTPETEFAAVCKSG